MGEKIETYGCLSGDKELLEDLNSTRKDGWRILIPMRLVPAIRYCTNCFLSICNYIGE